MCYMLCPLDSELHLKFLNFSSCPRPLDLDKEDPVHYAFDLEDPVHVACVTVAWPRLLLLCWHWLHRTPCPLLVSPGWSKVLEHTLVVIAKHSLQRARHGISPEEVVVESIVSIQPLARVQGEKFVNEVAGVLILDIRFQPLLHPPLALLWDLKLLK